jgi:hypothetical protein
MVIILILAAREVGFQPGQWAALVVATILLAGLCVWIISWEDRDDEAGQEAVSSVGQDEQKSLVNSSRHERS